MFPQQQFRPHISLQDIDLLEFIQKAVVKVLPVLQLSIPNKSKITSLCPWNDVESTKAELRTRFKLKYKTDYPGLQKLNASEGRTSNRAYCNNTITYSIHYRETAGVRSSGMQTRHIIRRISQTSTALTTSLVTTPGVGAPFAHISRWKPTAMRHNPTTVTTMSAHIDACP